MTFKSVHHFAIRVNDFDAAVETWRDKLGVTLDKITDSEALGAKQAVFTLPDGSYIEILSPTSDDSPIGKALSRGEGMHIMIMEVDNLEEALKHYEANGMTVVSNAGGQAVLHPKATNGLMLGVREA